MTFVAMQIPSRCEVMTSICHSYGAYVVSPCLLRILPRTQANMSLLQCLQIVGHSKSFQGTKPSRSAKIVSIKNAMQHSLGELGLKLRLTTLDQLSALPVKKKAKTRLTNSLAILEIFSIAQYLPTRPTVLLAFGYPCRMPDI
jgi:hypothetical protein